MAKLQRNIDTTKKSGIFLGKYTQFLFFDAALTLPEELLSVVLVRNR
jgi:hypothetical protein